MLAGAVKSEYLDNEAKRRNENLMLQPVVCMTLFLSIASLIRCIAKFTEVKREKNATERNLERLPALSCAELMQQLSCHGS